MARVHSDWSMHSPCQLLNIWISTPLTGLLYLKAGCSLSPIRMSVSVPPGSMVACMPRATVCKELGVKCHTDPQDPQPASELKLCFPLLWFPFHEDSMPETAEIYVGQGQRMCPKPTDGSHPTAFFLFRNTVSHSLEKHAGNTYCVPGSGMQKWKSAAPQHRSSHCTGFRQENKHGATGRLW